MANATVQPAEEASTNEESRAGENPLTNGVARKTRTRSRLRGSSDLPIWTKPPTDENGRLWYLGYGSNMNKKVLSDRRKVYPTKAVPVVIPGWKLCFNVPGMPYLEPAFGSVAPDDDVIFQDGSPESYYPTLQAVAFYITAEEMERIRETEGGQGHEGLGYGIAAVKAKPIRKVDGVNEEEIECWTLKYHDSWSWKHHSIPSRRYLDLLIVGAVENGLTPDYVAFLQTHAYIGKDCPSMTEFQRRRWAFGRTAFLLHTLTVGWFIPLTFYLITKFHLKPPRFISVAMTWVSRMMFTFHDMFYVPLFGSGLNLSMDRDDIRLKPYNRQFYLEGDEIKVGFAKDVGKSKDD